jgi:hypothetical protein
VILSAFFFGLGCSMREPMILLVILPMGLISDQLLWRRWIKIFLLFIISLGIMGISFYISLKLADWPKVHEGWLSGMSRERIQMTGWWIGLVGRNLVVLIVWLMIFSPLIIVTIPQQFRVMRSNPLGWKVPLVLACLVYIIGELANHTLVFNVRFVIFPGILLCIPAAMAILSAMPKFLKSPYLLAGIIILFHAVIISMTWSYLDGYYFEKSRTASDVSQTLKFADDYSLFIPGRLTPVVEFNRRIHNKSWRIIYGGWDFSDKELFNEVDGARNTGREIYIVEPDYWAEKWLRPGQYSAIESVWKHHPHQPSPVSHFHRLDFPPKNPALDWFKLWWQYLFS